MFYLPHIDMGPWSILQPTGYVNELPFVPMVQTCSVPAAGAPIDHSCSNGPNNNDNPQAWTGRRRLRCFFSMLSTTYLPSTLTGIGRVAGTTSL